jgi:hypothetical protein
VSDIMNKPVSRDRDDVHVARGQPATVLYRAAAAHARARVEPRTTAEVAAETMYGVRDPAVILARAASSPAVLTNTSWAGALAAVAVDDAIMAMSTLSAAADLIGRGTKVDLTGIAHLTVPGRVTSVSAAGQWVHEGSAIPVRSQSITTGAVLEPRKLAVIATMSAELAASSNVEQVVRALLLESSALALDAAIFSTNVDDGAHPAGILAGVAPLTATAGGGLLAFDGDMKLLIGALAANGAGRNPVIVCAPQQAVATKILAGPRFDIPVLPSSALAAGVVIAVEQSSFVSGFSAIPEFETSGTSLLVMEDTTPSDWGASMKSLYQADLFALKMILRAAWGLRAPHAAWLQNVTW